MTSSNALATTVAQADTSAPVLAEPTTPAVAPFQPLPIDEQSGESPSGSLGVCGLDGVCS